LKAKSRILQLCNMAFGIQRLILGEKLGKFSAWFWKNYGLLAKEHYNVNDRAQWSSELPWSGRNRTYIIHFHKYITSEQWGNFKAL